MSNDDWTRQHVYSFCINELCVHFLNSELRSKYTMYNMCDPQYDTAVPKLLHYSILKIKNIDILLKAFSVQVFYKNDTVCDRSWPFIKVSKTVPWLSPIHKEGNEPCFIYMIKYGCYFHPLRNFLLTISFL